MANMDVEAAVDLAQQREDAVRDAIAALDEDITRSIHCFSIGDFTHRSAPVCESYTLSRPTQVSGRLSSRRESRRGTKNTAKESSKSCTPSGTNSSTYTARAGKEIARTNPKR